jgi:NosR/NirI family nitrous oxide reductase transcriptional regulator
MSGYRKSAAALVARGGILIVVLLACAAVMTGPARAFELGTALDKIGPSEVVAGGERFGVVEGTPPGAAIYRGNEIVGYAFLNTDLVSAIGYSGKPIHILIGMTVDGTITSAKLVKHSEPIVLIGIPESRVQGFTDGYVGRNVRDFEAVASAGESTPDIISGATVTVMVIDDSILRVAIKFARSRGLAGLAKAAAVGGEAATRRGRALDPKVAAGRDWITLVGDGSVRRLNLSVGEVTQKFTEDGKPKAAERPESADPTETFIDLYSALVSVPAIGRDLLGAAEYGNLTKRLAPGQQALVVAANGLFSFKGSGYVRGGLFDRIQLVQGDNSFRFRDKQHKRLGKIAARHAQDFKEIGLFLLPADGGFDPAMPWRLELLANRAVGALEKEFLMFEVDYLLPEYYLASPPAATAVAAPETSAVPAEDAVPELWRRIWQDRLVDVSVLGAAILVLTGLFFFQNWFVRRPRLASAVRVGFLIFTVAWIGGYAQAQLSVVNVLTFANAFITGFKWEYFLMDPLIFILWVSVAASLLFWGRGAYCGWLCPFGALQELLNKAAKLVRVPQFEMPWALHERLWPVKYLLFLGLFGISLYSLAFAEQIAEIEPFKTVVILRFAHEWPFVLYAGLLLAIGLFVERFFCRYICPLGGALAIPGKLRIFEWLRRHKECGSPCHRCAKECMVQAIHPEGQINPNECLYCLHCQQLYYDAHECPAMIQRRLKRERRQAMASKNISVPRPAAMPAAAAPEVKLKGPSE